MSYNPKGLRDNHPVTRRGGGAVSGKPRVLIFQSPVRNTAELLQRCQPEWEWVRVENLAQGLTLLHCERFDGIFADTHDPVLWNRTEHLLQSERILQALDDGVALVDPQLRISWANKTFDAW